MDAPLRQPIPLARSILWNPVAAGTRRPDDAAFPIFVGQSAVQAIYEHVAAPRPPEQDLLGFLLGDLCECPVTNVSYLVVDAALRLTQPIAGDRTRDVVARLWDRLQAQLEAQHARLIGWYRTQAARPLELSPHDVETHENYFADPWQVAVLLGANAREPAGAFFRAGRENTWVSTPLPFYELLKEDSIRPDGKKRSFVTWKNYRALTPVVPPALRAAPSTASAEASPRGQPASVAPGPEPSRPRASAPEPKESGAPQSSRAAPVQSSAEPPIRSVGVAEPKRKSQPRSSLNGVEGVAPPRQSLTPPPSRQARPLGAEKRVLGAVAVEVALLVAVAAFVESTVIRVGLALATALLLAYRAATVTLRTTVGVDSDIPDQVVRGQAERLLLRIREFYTACHLARSDKLSTGEALQRVQAIEKDLNQLLADMMRASGAERRASAGKD